MLSLVFFNGCGEKEQTTGDFTAKQAGELLEQISKNPLGVKFEADPADITVEAANNQYVLTLKNPVLSVDLSVFKELIPGPEGEKLQGMRIPMNMKEMILVYNPGEKFLAIQSLSGFNFKWTFKEAGQEMSFDMTTEFMSFEKYDISAFLDTKQMDMMDMLIRFMGDNSSNVGSSRGFSYRFSFPVLQKVSIIDLNIGEMEWKQQAGTDFFMSIFGKEDSKINLQDLLDTGKPLFDMSGSFKDLSFKVSEGEKILAGGQIADSSIEYFLKPENEKKFFKYGFNWDLTGFGLDVPGEKLANTLGDLKSMKLKFAFKHLTTGFLHAYLDVVKLSMQSKPANAEEAKQAQMAQGMQIIGEVTKSQPIITFSLSPMVHAFGEMWADAHFQFMGPTAPTGKAQARIVNMDQVMEKLKANTLIPAEFIKKLQSFFVKDDKGEGVMTFESKEDQPGVFLLNGQPIKM